MPKLHACRLQLLCHSSCQSCMPADCSFFATAHAKVACLQTAASLPQLMPKLHACRLQLLCHSSCQSCMPADCSFFATAHAKGPIYGIGGKEKRQFWRTVQEEKAVVTPESFTDTVSRLTKINIVLCFKEKIAVDNVHILQTIGQEDSKLWKKLNYHTARHKLNSKICRQLNEHRKTTLMPTIGRT